MSNSPSKASIFASSLVDLGSTMCRHSKRVRLPALFAGTTLLLSPHLLAREIDPGMGVSFGQVNFTFPGAVQMSSSYGQVFVDFNQILNGTGLSSGFVNVASDQGWIVQNLPVVGNSGIPGLSAMFNLGLPSQVSAFDAYVDFSQSPISTFSPSTPREFSIRQVVNNAEGASSSNRAKVPGPPPAPLRTFSDLGTSFIEFILGHARSVETAINQCVPAAIANSLQFLSETTGIALKQENIPGVNGEPPNSLVGQIDVAMERPPGFGVGYHQMISGKLNYLSLNGLGNSIVNKFQSSKVGSDVEKAGLTAYRKGGAPTFDFINSELRHGEDVELVVAWKDAGGGHAVELVGSGVTLGVPWIAFTHDAVQGDNSSGTSLSDGGFGFSYLVDTDQDGLLNFHNYVDGSEGQVTQVLSESLVPGPFPLFGVGAAFGYSRKLRKIIKRSKMPEALRAVG